MFVNGGSRATIYLSSTLLQVTLMPSDLAQSGTLNITVVNPPPGGGTTAAISFVVADYKCERHLFKPVPHRPANRRTSP